MTKYISLFGATTTDTQVQVVKENQVIIGIGAGASRKRYVVYKVEHTARGYVYHMVDTETKEISQTDILRPLSQTFGIGRYYDDVNPEFMDAFEVALLVRQAEEQATAQAIAAAKGIDMSKCPASSGRGSAVPPSVRYSTLQDLDAGRHTEIDMFSGALMAMGKELGIPTPYNEYTYHIIKALEEKNDGLFDYSGQNKENTCAR